MTITSAWRNFAHSTILMIVAVALNACEQASQQYSAERRAAQTMSTAEVSAGYGGGGLLFAEAEPAPASPWGNYRFRDRFEAFADNQVFITKEQPVSMPELKTSGGAQAALEADVTQPEASQPEPEKPQAGEVESKVDGK